jgi:chaperonin GroES
MKVKPLGNRILVKQLSSEEVTKSGIVLPSTAEKNEKSQYEIIALGNGEEIAKLGLSVGNIVVAGKYSGDEVDNEDDQEGKYKILFVGREKDESDILAVIEK